MVPGAVLIINSVQLCSRLTHRHNKKQIWELTKNKSDTDKSIPSTTHDLMSITDSLNDTIVPLNESPPTAIAVEMCPPSYDLSDVSVDESQLLPCDHAVMPHDDPRAALILEQSPNSSATSIGLLEQAAPLAICNPSRKSFQNGPSPPQRKQTPTFLQRRRANTADSGRSQNSFRSLLGDRKRRSVHPCLAATEIVIGAIVGESDLIFADNAEPTDSPNGKRMTAKQRMRKVSKFVRDLVRCMPIVSKPFRICGRKAEDVILLRADGRLT